MNSLIPFLDRVLRFAKSDGHLERAARKLAQKLNELSSSHHVRHPVFRQQAIFRLSEIAERIDELSHGVLAFGSTETWRTVYEDILKSCDHKRYLSSALIRSDGYWRDNPGTSSLEFNYQLVEHGYLIHRLFLIDDFFWPPSMSVPAQEILQWIQTQDRHGIEVGLVRLSDLDVEPELVCDLGIYGDQAVGRQTTDSEGRTTRFEICFSPEKVALARQQWSQLSLYAVSLEELGE